MCKVAPAAAALRMQTVEPSWRRLLKHGRQYDRGQQKKEDREQPADWNWSEPTAKQSGERMSQLNWPTICLHFAQPFMAAFACSRTLSEQPVRPTDTDFCFKRVPITGRLCSYRLGASSQCLLCLLMHLISADQRKKREEEEANIRKVTEINIISCSAI